MRTNAQIAQSLSTKQKANLFVGKNNWEMEAIAGKNIFFSDGPYGIRKEIEKNGKKRTVKAVCYPAAALSACSFNVELMKRYGKELAKECIRHRIDVLLGPGINIKRNPLCGRNFEYFSEDPYLTGKLASAYIQGVQSENIGVSLKHYALNSQETARLINDSVADERALREIYLKAFEIAMKESSPWTIMASYNKINGEHATENQTLLTDIARKEFGFDGVFVSDWGALYRSVESLQAGLDLEMPGLSKGSEIKIAEAIRRKKLPVKVLNASTERLLDLYRKTEQEKKDDFNLSRALAVAKEINDESIVLLKNENQLLPLNRNAKIALIGDFCRKPRYQGGGSSQINPIYMTDLYTEMKKEGIAFEFAAGYRADSEKPQRKWIEEAKQVAKGKDAVVILCGLPEITESEGFDRENLDMPLSQRELIREIAEVNRNLVIVLQNGAPITMPFLDKAGAILETYLGGSMHAKSIRDILFGKVNPSGRLAESFPVSYSDVPSAKYYLKNKEQSLYKESIYVGYRYYDTFGKKVLFPFGYGLSYAEIAYSDFRVRAEAGEYVADFTLTNRSDIPAKEVVQLYVGQTDGTMFKAKKELAAFAKISLQAGETKKVSLRVKAENLAYYSLAHQKWQIENGIYRFYLARHAMDDSLYTDVAVESGSSPEAKNPKLRIYDTMHREVTDAEFAELLGRKINRQKKGKEFTIETPVRRFCRTALGWILLRPIILYRIATAKDSLERKALRLAIPDLPLRILQINTTISKRRMEAIVDIFNGKYYTAIRKWRLK